MEFPEGLEKIGPYAFMESSLMNIKLPASLRTVAQGAFARCTCFGAVKFSKGLEVLGMDESSDNSGG